MSRLPRFKRTATVPYSEDVDPEQKKAIREAVIAASRKTYARPRAEIEAAMRAKLGVEDTGQNVAEVKPVLTPLPKRAAPEAAEVQKPEKPPGSEAGPPTVTEVKVRTAPAPPGTGAEGISHTHIKDNIGAEAESLDYTVSYEELFPEVRGRADVVLRRGSLTVICQVSVTTQVEYEAASVRKFLQTSFRQIAVVSSNRKKLGQIREALGHIGDQSARVGFYSPEEFISKLYDWAADDPEGGSLERGKLRKRPITLAEQTQNEQLMLAEIKERMKR